MIFSSGNASWQAVTILGLIFLPFAFSGFLDARKHKRDIASGSLRPRGELTSSELLSRQWRFVFRFTRWPLLLASLCMTVMGVIFGWLA